VSQSASRIARSYLWSMLIWLSRAPMNAGQDRVDLLDSGLYVPYWILLLSNSIWMIAAALFTPPLFAVVRRYPVVEGHRASRAAGYLLGTLPYLAVSSFIRWVLLPPLNPASNDTLQSPQ
jgi:hypothetical protein